MYEKSMIDKKNKNKGSLNFKRSYSVLKKKLLHNIHSYNSSKLALLNSECILRFQSL